MNITGRGILLDIEGTTSSIRFVYDEMFPFVRRVVHTYLHHAWQQPDVQQAVAQMRQDHLDGRTPTDAPPPGSTHDASAAEVADYVLALMDHDAKTTGLKQLQGLIWQAGFQQGDLIAHVYDDVPPTLQRWHQAGHDIRIYSSGSVLAQQLFFSHTSYGNLLPLFRDHYDTTLGGKREPESYQKIAQAFNLPAASILFVSDVAAELDAAAAVGYQTALSLRPENPTQPSHSHPTIHSFSELW